MKRWIGARRNLTGHAFNKKVALRMRELGWQAESDVKLSKILNRRLDRDYGDVDVLAWRVGVSNVFCIECKELTHDRTIGEIASRLTEYRGDVDATGKPDRLKRHLLREELLKANLPALQRYLKRDEATNVCAAVVFDRPVPMQLRPSASLARLVVATLDSLPAAFDINVRPQ